MALGRKTGGGSRKGSPNKATSAVRLVFTQFVERNAPGAQELYDRVAADDPAKALELLAKLAEFVIPKLARSELAAPETGSPEQIRIVFVHPKKSAVSLDAAPSR